MAGFQKQTIDRLWKPNSGRREGDRDLAAAVDQDVKG